MRRIALAVNDDPENLILLTVQLLKLGLQVMAGCSEDAFALARLLKPRIIFIDYIPSDREDDLGLVADLKQSEDLCHIPVIVVSGRMYSKGIEDSIKVGAEAFIRKPYDFVQIKDVVDRFANGSH